eukprot:GHRQ01019271.1.p1 GENE.GHRQ01019271.1~~GHRQ01019271.1.p1  ORF type:complete len:224 (-),score=9.11 GHRQ01019271.1:52-723(-)
MSWRVPAEILLAPPTEPHEQRRAGELLAQVLAEQPPFIWPAHAEAFAHQQKGQPNERAKATTAFSLGAHRLGMSTSAASLDRMTCTAANRVLQELTRAGLHAVCAVRLCMQQQMQDAHASLPHPCQSCWKMGNVLCQQPKQMVRMPMRCCLASLPSCLSACRRSMCFPAPCLPAQLHGNGDCGCPQSRAGIPMSAGSALEVLDSALALVLVAWCLSDPTEGPC